MSTDPERPPYNPYAAPLAEDAVENRARAAGRVPGEMVKWVYVAVSAVILGILIVLFFRTYLGFSPTVRDVLVTLADKPLIWILFILALVWVYESWSGVPERLRGDITPGNAVGRLFIPLYNLYWIFAVNLRLCESLDSALAVRGDRRRSPRGWAVIAPIAQLTTNLVLFSPLKTYGWVLSTLTHLAWIAFMLECDPIRRSVIEFRAGGGRT